MKTTLSLFVMFIVFSCNAQDNTYKHKTDSVMLKVNIINSLPVGWGIRYTAVIEKVLNGNAQDMKDTIEFGITATKEYNYLNIGATSLITFYNTKKINSLPYLPPINGTVSKLNEIWLISKMEKVTQSNERRTFVGRAIISNDIPMFVLEFSDSEAFYIEGLKNWDDKYLNKTITIEGILTHYIDGLYSGQVIKDWIIIEPSQENYTLADSIFGDNYKSVVIGNQEWMAENLKVNIFRNGDTIPHAATNEEWERAGKEGKPAWCYYDNNNTNGKKFGKLYNWHAVNDPRGLAPEGWHIPTEDNFLTLLSIFGNKDSDAYHTLVENCSSGFNAFFAGWRYYDGSFFTIFNNAYLWSSSGTDTSDGIIGSAYYMGITSYNESVEIYFGHKGLGLSVRCIKK